MKWYTKVLKNYAKFSGRARRKEYWMFTLINVIIGFILGFFMVVVGHEQAFAEGSIGFFYTILILYQLAILIPTVAVSVRRLHDTGYSGWWYLLVLIPILGSLALLIFFLLDGVEGENQYGPDPKGATAKKY